MAAKLETAVHNCLPQRRCETATDILRFYNPLLLKRVLAGCRGLFWWGAIITYRVRLIYGRWPHNCTVVPYAVDYGIALP